MGVMSSISSIYKGLSSSRRFCVHWQVIKMLFIQPALLSAYCTLQCSLDAAVKTRWQVV